MSAEDRLRDILRSEATTIVPAGDGLARIRERVTRRRRVRLWLVPSAALVTVGVAAAFFLLGPDDGHRPTTLQQASASPTETSSASPTPAAADDGGYPLDVPAMWPFTSQEQARSWQTVAPWAQDGLQVGKHFVGDYLGLTGVTVTQSCVSCDTLGLEVAGATVGEIDLARVGVGFSSGHGAQVYTVVRVSGTDLTITSPGAGAAITSPIQVTGRLTGVDENVALRLLTDSGRELASAGAPAGSAQPWSATLTFDSTGWSHGALVGVTRSSKDGAVTRVVAVPVTRGQATSTSTASPTSSFAALVDGHVALFDAVSGKQLRQLTYPPAGKHDVESAWSRGTLAWVRVSTTKDCVNELDRLDAGKASTVAASTVSRYGSPALSPDGALLGWVETPCGTTQPARDEVVLTSQGSQVRRWAGPTGGSVLLVGVRNDGSALVWVRAAAGAGVLRLVRPEDGTGPGTPAYQPDQGCTTTPAAAFVDGGVIAFEDCSGTVRLVHVGPDNRIASRDRVISAEAPQSIRVRDGLVLVHLFGGDMYGAIATYAAGSFTTIITNDSPACASTGSGKGCVGDPSW